jgi:hypothetical protein
LQPIKIAWTKSIIAFGKAGEDTLIDAVPLDEVTDIHIMQDGSMHIPVSYSLSNKAERVSSTSQADKSTQENDQNNSNQSHSQQSSTWIARLSRKGSACSKNLSANQSNDAHAHNGKGLTATGSVMIMTNDHGYNSGRKYYFQAKSDSDRREIVEILAARSKAARASKEAKGKLQRIRDRVSAFTKSDSFQYFFAFLIAMVRL